MVSTSTAKGSACRYHSCEADNTAACYLPSTTTVCYLPSTTTVCY